MMADNAGRYVGSEHYRVTRDMALYVGDAMAKLNGKSMPLMEWGSTGPVLLGATDEP